MDFFFQVPFKQIILTYHRSNKNHYCVNQYIYLYIWRFLLYFVKGDLTNGKRKSAAYKGTTFCSNDECMLYLEYRKRNTTHIKKRESDQICMLCGSTMESLSCKAWKIWEFQDDNLSLSNIVEIIHANSNPENLILILTKY